MELKRGSFSAQGYVWGGAFSEDAQMAELMEIGDCPLASKAGDSPSTTRANPGDPNEFVKVGPVQLHRFISITFSSEGCLGVDVERQSSLGIEVEIFDLEAVIPQ
jgi:hypothetical protein